MECHFFPLESAFWCIKLHVLKRNQKKWGCSIFFSINGAIQSGFFPFMETPMAPTSLFRVQNLGLPIWNLEIHGDFMGSWGFKPICFATGGDPNRPAFCRLYVRRRCRVVEGMAKACGKYRAAAMESKRWRAIPIRGEISNEFCQVATLQKLVSSRLVRSNEV